MSSSTSLEKYDAEKGPDSPIAQTNVVFADDGVNRTSGPLRKMWAIVQKLDSYGVEVRGVERVPESERTHGNLMDSGFLWMSANFTISTFSLGTLGNSIWYMGTIDACLTILFFNLITTIPVALFSCWGAQSGLRQMCIGRYSFGSVGIFLPIILNCLACIGWSTINTIVGAQALQAVSPAGKHEIPTAAGIVLIAVLTLIVALFGYRIVHMFERYASIPVVVIMLIYLIQIAPHVSSGFADSVGAAEAASVLSFGGTIAGFSFGWTSLAADYTVNFPADSSATKIFAYTYAGLNLPLIVMECIGALAMGTFVNKPTWAAAAEEGENLGGLLGAPLYGPMGGFGRFLLVILALSIVANNIPNMYSFALTFQAFGKFAQSIPRMFLVCIGTAIYIVLAILGADHFKSTFDTLLVILSYWLMIYSVILIEEHFIFRKGSFQTGYDLEGWNDRSKLPTGYAALGATAVGAVGVVLGMAQTWYVGVVGIKIGGPPYGGDIGFEMAGSFAAIAYPGLRYLEKKYTGR